MRQAIVFAVVVAFTAVAIADIIHLKDGRKLEGKIVEESKDNIKLKMKHGEIIIKRDEVKRVEKKQAENRQADEITKLKEEIKRLKVENANLRKRVVELEELCKKHGIELPKNKATDQKEKYKYLGKPRSKGWFMRMYKKYHRQIVYANGKFIDIGKGLMWGFQGMSRQKRWGVKMPEVGMCFMAGARAEKGILGHAYGTWSRCNVFQIVDKDEVLVRSPGGGGWSELFFHVKGVNTEGLIDGADFQAKVVSIGTYRYTAVTGAAKTIPSFVVYKPLTCEQFAKALSESFELKEYKAKKIKSGKDSVRKVPRYKITSVPEK